MKVCINREPFLRALSFQSGIVERKGTVPILSHVLIVASNEQDGRGGALVLTGTDLEASLVEMVPCSMEIAGETTVSVHMLFDIVRKLTQDSDISMCTSEGDAQFLTLTSADSEFKLPTLPAIDFPQIHPRALQNSITIDGSLLRQLINKTKFAMSTDESRHVLNGLYFHIDDEKICAVATDAHRLALSCINVAGASKDMPSIIVGRKSINELSKLLERCEGSARISFSSSQILVEFGDVCFSSRLVEGKFPDYNLAIPKDFSFSISVVAKEVANSVDRVAMMSPEKNRAVRVSLQNSQMSISAYSEQYGSGIERIHGVGYDSSDVFSINFNPRYLMDICAQATDEGLVMNFKDSTSQMLVRDPSDDRSVYVLMPMRS
ncbi:DNA polymerase III subunit beta [Candidatus Hydrogenosomobacter endosymbioticus]|uniref:Beta sliding clamp n=1 Tax=Candidatus Hydrogenosomobacter endosymbioticus TaxID=2558174 RepID=A0ABM7V931_9PROT|nr:DNA polymerase III subunit beta [Candidatus Hydrogenosomobacter endosymbioticus]BDB96303.1 DNA polymerase III subunit beta [Candidatus Hydrogenosomobacter endosymbioticus]